MPIPIALTIAGSDPGGGAGLQADLKTFHQLGVYGQAAVTLITVQNTMRVSRIVPLDAALVGEQIDAVLEDLPPDAIKVGALGSAAIARAIAERHFRVPLVIDPVITGKHGGKLMGEGAREALTDILLPRAALITPNLEEAAELAGMPVANLAEMKEAAERIAKLGVPSVLVKGGHLEGDAVDILFHRGAHMEFRARRVISRHTHGTGCTYSAAITAYIAQAGARESELEEAVRRAKTFITNAIRTAPGIGRGNGPLNHWASERESEPDPL